MRYQNDISFFFMKGSLKNRKINKQRFDALLFHFTNIFYSLSYNKRRKMVERG